MKIGCFFRVKGVTLAVNGNCSAVVSGQKDTVVFGSSGIDCRVGAAAGFSAWRVLLAISGAQPISQHNGNPDSRYIWRRWSFVSDSDGQWADSRIDNYGKAAEAFQSCKLFESGGCVCGCARDGYLWSMEN